MGRESGRGGGEEGGGGGLEQVEGGSWEDQEGGREIVWGKVGGGGGEVVKGNELNDVEGDAEDSIRNPIETQPITRPTAIHPNIPTPVATNPHPYPYPTKHPPIPLTPKHPKTPSLHQFPSQSPQTKIRRAYYPTQPMQGRSGRFIERVGRQQEDNWRVGAKGLFAGGGVVWAESGKCQEGGLLAGE